MSDSNLLCECLRMMLGADSDCYSQTSRVYHAMQLQLNLTVCGHVVFLFITHEGGLNGYTLNTENGLKMVVSNCTIICVLSKTWYKMVQVFASYQSAHATLLVYVCHFLTQGAQQCAGIKETDTIYCGNAVYVAGLVSG